MQAEEAGEWDGRDIGCNVHVYLRLAAGSFFAKYSDHAGNIFTTLPHGTVISVGHQSIAFAVSTLPYPNLIRKHKA